MTTRTARRSAPALASEPSEASEAPAPAEGPEEPRRGPAARTSRAPKLDAACVDAAPMALAAAQDVGGAWVGEHVTAIADGERVVTHQFAATQPGYQGWYWSVTVARAPRAKLVTVSEIALLPGSSALLAPEWVPWSERLRPGDLGVGDVMPTAPDDDRLTPGYVLTDDDALDPAGPDAEVPAPEPVAADPELAELDAGIGFGRLRSMSRLGREETADRWYTGSSGPAAELAKAAPAHCGTCGFYLPLRGSLGAVFGACGNLFAPDDARIVSADHGCGAHSEALVEVIPSVPPRPIGPDDDLEIIRTAHTPGSVEDSAETEPLGHG